MLKQFFSLYLFSLVDRLSSEQGKITPKFLIRQLGHWLHSLQLQKFTSMISILSCLYIPAMQCFYIWECSRLHPCPNFIKYVKYRKNLIPKGYKSHIAQITEKCEISIHSCSAWKHYITPGFKSPMITMYFTYSVTNTFRALQIKGNTCILHSNSAIH